MARPLHKRQCKYKVKSSNALPPNINIVVLTHTESLYFDHKFVRKFYLVHMDKMARNSRDRETQTDWKL